MDYLKEKYQMVCVIRTLKPSIHRRSITMWIFTYSMEYLYHHNYKLNSRHSKWTSYTEIISSTINLGKMKTSVTRTSSHSLLDKKPWSKLHLKQNYQIGRYSLFLCGWTLHFHSFGCLVSPFPHMKWLCVSRFIMRKNKDDVKIRR